MLRLLLLLLAALIGCSSESQQPPVVESPSRQMTDATWRGIQFDLAHRVGADAKQLAGIKESSDILMDDIEYHHSHDGRVIGFTCNLIEIPGDGNSKSVDIRYLRKTSFDGSKNFYGMIYGEYGDQLVLDLRAEPEVAAILQEHK